MKNEMRVLVATTALFGFFTAGTDARADSKQECAAAYENTQTFREHGHMIDARKQAVACSASTCSVYVIRDCAQWLTEIDATLPTVIFTAKDGGGAEAMAVRVTVDGQPVTEKLGGEAVPLDPGEHVVRFEMVGAEAIEQTVTIQQGEKNRNLAASFKKAPRLTPPVALLASATPTTLAAPKPHVVPVPTPDGERSGGVPVWAWVSGGVGVVALGVGAVFGVSGLNAQSELITRCGGHVAFCSASTKAVTVPLAERRTLDRNLSIGFGAAALVGIGAAVIGIVRAPAKVSSLRTGFILAPFGSPSGGGLTMQGQF